MPTTKNGNGQSGSDLARNRLIPFCRKTAPFYRPSWHHRLLASRLEAVERGEVKRLAIFMPPRHGKSELASVRFPAWYLGRNPDKRVITCSYGSELALDFSQQTKDVLASEEYQALFSDTHLSRKTNRRDRWKIEGRRGGLLAAGVGGSITGFGADLLIIDDPVKNDQDANSKTIRERNWNWFGATAYTRLEDNGAIVLIQTRWHKDDLSGKLLDMMHGGGEQWEVLDLPAFATGDEDWGIYGKRSAGQALWQSKYSEADLERIRGVMGEYWFSALYQQDPRLLDGNILDSRLLVGINKNALPPLVKVCRFWDLAFSERDGADYLAGALCGIDAHGRFYILDMMRLRGGWTQNKRRIYQMAQADGQNVHVIIESNGTQLGYYQQVKDELRSHLVYRGDPQGDKPMRASLWGSRLEDGIIYCVRGNWNPALFAEMDDFPHGDHDDQVDAVSGAWAYLVGRVGGILATQ